VSDFELFNNPDVHARNRMVIEAVDFIQRIWSQDPPYDLQGEFWQVRLKDGIIPELGVGFMPKPYQTPGPADLDLAREPELLLRAHRCAQGLGNDLANIIPTYSVGEPLGRLLQGLRRSRYPRQRRELAGRAQCAGGTLGLPRHVTAYSASRAPTGISTPICARFSAESGSSSILKPRPDMPDEQATVDAITRECVTYGSPKAVLDKLVAFRERVGPFGTLLMTGLDWGGPNAAWERESMRLLAQEVMPKFRQHVLARAAE
jgi:alkanesulfonate monooxygenase SsuD/methylene tetrahydromethanopterin reductase-like flavin-dependent oxidoreductase (luciferase family)